MSALFIIPFAVLILLQNFQVASCQQPCGVASFPKVMGSTTNDTLFFHFDINYSLQIMVAAGYSNDSALRNDTSLSKMRPLIAFYQDSTFTLQWAKSVLLDQFSFENVCLNNDAQYIFAYASSYVQSSSCLIFFNTSGAVVNARKYSNSMKTQFTYTQGLLLSTGSSPKAFVQAKQCASISCTGYHIFQFPMLPYSNTSIQWFKQSKNQAQNDKGYFLIFGENEDVLYGFGYQYDSGIIYRLNAINGNVIWNYQFSCSPQTLARFDYQSQYLEFKAFSTNQVLIASLYQQDTGPLRNIYGRLILSNQSITQSDLFVDNMKDYIFTRSIYIVSESQIKVLQNKDKSFLASIDFTTLLMTIKYFQANPNNNFYGMQLSKFVNENKLYSLFNGNNFGVSFGGGLTAPEKGILVSSDDSESCYYNYVLPPFYRNITQIYPTVSQTVNSTYPFLSVSNPSFQNVSLTSYSINISKMTNISSSCTNHKYEINPYPQTTANFTFEVPESYQKVILTNYSANILCGTTIAPVFTYTFNYIKSHDYFSLSSSTGQLSFNNYTVPGIYYFNIVGKLQTGQNASQDFYLTFLPGNHLPKFNASLIDQTVSLNQIGLYALPTFSDADNDPVILSTFLTGGTALPNFITFDPALYKYTFSPAQFSDVGLYSITVKLDDGKAPTPPTFSFKLNIENTPPLFSTWTLSNQIVPLNSIQTYQIPTYSDAEGNSVTIKLYEDGSGKLPVFATFVDPTFTFQPTQFSEVGSHNIIVELSDGQPLVNQYSFKVEVTNSAPIFASPLVDTNVSLNQVKTINLPPFSDQEGNSVTIEITQAPTFVTLSGSSLILQPTQLTDAGSHIVKIALKDGQPLQTLYQMTITVISNAAPTFNSNLQNQVVKLNQLVNYQLPSYSDPNNYPVTIDLTSQPGFVKLNSETLTINPTQFSEIGDSIVTVILKNSNNDQTSYSITVTITNSAPIFNQPISDQTVRMNQIVNYQLPTTLDNEGNAVIISLNSNPSFVTLSGSVINISPTQFSDIHDHTFQVIVSDGQPLSTSYSMKISVTNTAPTFDSQPIFPSVKLNDVIKYQLPSFTDLEMNPVTVEIQSAPSFVQLSGTDIQIHPTQFIEVGSSTVTIVLKDGQPLSSTYNIPLLITNTAPIFTSSLSDVSVSLNSVKTTNLPPYFDQEGNSVTIEITQAPSFVTLSGISLLVQPTQLTDVGSHIVKIALKDGQPLSTNYQMAIIVTQNTSPTFISNPLDQIVKLNQIVNQQLPGFSDPNNYPVTVLLTNQPGFVKLSIDTLTINPIQFSEVGDSMVTITLQNSNNDQSSYSITVTVTNSAPIFTQPITNQIASLNQLVNYQLPPTQDSEGNAVTITLNSNPSFVTLSGSVIMISPTLFSDVHDHNFQIIVSDGQPLSTTYSMSISVNNTAPTFDSQPIIPSVKLNDVISYQLPSYTDLEMNPVTIEMQSSPSFVSLSGTVVKINPTQFNEVGSNTVTIVLKDGQPLSTNYIVPLLITNSAPVFTKLPQNQQVELNKLTTYSLPPMSDAESNAIQITLKNPIPSFISLSGSDLMINPNLESDLGLHSITFLLEDGQPLSSTYTIDINVVKAINHPPYFISSIEDQVVDLNIKKSYTLPQSIDPEGSPTQIIADQKPNYAKLSGNIFEFYPTLNSELGKSEVKITLEDPDSNQVKYSFNVNVINTPPKFGLETLNNQTVQKNQINQFLLPPATDINGQTISISASLKNSQSTILPEFIQFNGTGFMISPISTTIVGSYLIQVELSDSIDSSLYYFLIDVVEIPESNDTISKITSTLINTAPPTFVSQSLPSVQVYATKTSNFTLPDVVDIDGDSFTITVDLGVSSTFTSYDSVSKTFFFNPTNELINSIPYAIKISFADSSKTSTYYLNIIVSALQQNQTTVSNSSTIFNQTQQTNSTQQQLNQSAFPNTIDNNKIDSATLKIIGINNQGLVIFQIVSENQELRQKVVEQFDPSLVNITLLNLKTNYSVSITEKNFEQSTISVKINFEDPTLISQGMELDQIQISMQQEFSIHNKLLQITPANHPSEIFTVVLPQQLTKQNAKILQNIQVGQFYASSVCIPTLLITGLAFNSVLPLIWSLLSNLQFIMLLSLISMNVPGIAQDFQKSILDLAFLDILKTENWLTNFYQRWMKYNREDDTPLNIFFLQKGYHSKKVLLNIGSCFIYLGALLLGILAWSIVYLLKGTSKFCTNCEAWMRQNVAIRSPLRFLLQFYSPLVLASAINLYDINFDNGNFSLINSCVSIALLTAIHLATLAALVKLFFNASISENKTLSPLLSSLKRKEGITKYWNLIMLLREGLTISILLVLRDSYLLQILTLLFISLLMTIAAIKIKPMEEQLELSIQIFNEVMAQCYLFTLLCLTEYQQIPQITRVTLGNVLLSIVTLTTSINVIKTLAQIIKELRRYWLRRQNMKKKKRSIRLEETLEQNKLMGSTLKTLPMLPEIDNNNINVLESPNQKENIISIAPQNQIQIEQNQDQEEKLPNKQRKQSVDYSWIFQKEVPREIAHKFNDIEQPQDMSLVQKSPSNIESIRHYQRTLSNRIQGNEGQDSIQKSMTARYQRTQTWSDTKKVF